jgi:hypothetical protein
MKRRPIWLILTAALVLAVGSTALGVSRRSVSLVASTGISATPADSSDGTQYWTITNTSPGGGGATSVTASGAGITASPTTGAVVIANTGVTSIASGGSTVCSPSTGASTCTTANTVGNGLTGDTTLTAHGPLIGEGTGAIAAAGAGGVGIPFIGQGASADPLFGGPVIVAGGGTGLTSISAHGLLIGNGTSAVTVSGAGLAGQVLVSNGVSADPTFQAAVVPAGSFPSCYAIGSTTNLGISQVQIGICSITSATAGQEIIQAHLQVTNTTITTCWNTGFCISINSTTACASNQYSVTSCGTNGTVNVTGSVGFRNAIAASTTDTYRLLVQNVLGGPSTLSVSGDIQAWLTQ